MREVISLLLPRREKSTGYEQGTEWRIKSKDGQTASNLKFLCPFFFLRSTTQTEVISVLITGINIKRLVPLCN